MTYDRVGRKTSVAEHSGRTEQYVYDAAGRLITSAVTMTGGGAFSTTYHYDAVGNRLRRDDAAGVTHYSYDVRDRLVQVTSGVHLTTYQYDLNGNLLGQDDGSQVIEYTWDAANRLVATRSTLAGNSTTVEYTYSPDGERYERIENGVATRYVIDPNREHSVVLAELENGEVVTGYLRPPAGEAAIGLIQDGTTLTIFATGMGTTRLVTDQNGMVTDTFVVGPFGEVISRTGATLGVPIYNGEFRDAVTGLDYLRARFYSPDVGRFVSMDPFEGWQDIPISMNKYVYAHSDPINGKDPTGLWTLNEVAFTSGMLGFLIGGVHGFFRNDNLPTDELSGITDDLLVRAGNAASGAFFGSIIGTLTGVVIGIIIVPSGGGTAGLTITFLKSLSAETGWPLLTSLIWILEE